MNTHTHTHNFEYYHEIETYCPEYRVMATLILGTNEECKGKIVKGKPVACNHEQTCPRKGKTLCYLKAINIETKKK